MIKPHSWYVIEYPPYTGRHHVFSEDDALRMAARGHQVTPLYAGDALPHAPYKDSFVPKKDQR